MVRRALTYAMVMVTACTLATGCDNGKTAQNAAEAPTAPSPIVTTAPTATPSPTTSEKPTPKPAPKPQKLKVGSKGPAVLALQQRLTELGYWNGKADSKFGGSTQQAVFALQKAAGIGRDGSVGPKTQKALDAGVRPTPKSKPGSGYLVEINLKKQLLMLVEDGRAIVTLNTSTGSNEHYEYEGDTYLADTPPGKFTMGRQIDGVRHGPLGDLWRPKYFNGGIAIHGSPSIPPYPASHGCARLSNAAMNWIWANNKIPLKTKVWVYNG
jgi:peptidoglycan hydrolase-like protein with peptidoglycan-binding domain